MSISSKYNPYDFSNPVSDPDLFIGRSSELEEVQYYLEQSYKAPRSVNLALIGARASGKTSMLNMIEVEAKKLGFCVARIDLDESDVENQLAFFFKLIDTILTTASQEGAFGGLQGKTYDIYRDTVDSYEIIEDKTFCPFIFPIQYARAMDKSNYTAIISDAVIKQDLNVIYKNLNKPIIILFDECDVLTKSRVHLQKLRNIFMNTTGYMLVFTGTPALFPVMNDVFSPIIRQFKKINVGPFQKEQDTEECIRAPLIKIGIDDPKSIFDFETYQDIRDIHNLSSGKPYEIQLICHFLFKRIQTGRAKKMELSIDVLDDVLKELQASQDFSSRRILTDVRNFSESQLKSLGTLCACNGYATLEQIWFIEHIFEFGTSLEELKEHLTFFERMGIIKLNNGIINFSGDDFDKIYCKYLARKRDIFLYINEFPFEVWLDVLLTTNIKDNVEDAYAVPVVTIGGTANINIQDVVKNMLNNENSDVFESTPDLAEAIYWSSIRNKNEVIFYLAYILVSTPWLKTRHCFTIQSNDIGTAVGQFNSYVNHLNELAAESDSEVQLTIEHVNVIDYRILAKKLKASGNERLRNTIVEGHRSNLYDSYFENDNVAEASFHAEVINILTTNFDDTNNFGYINLVEGNLDQAESLLTHALEQIKKDDENIFQEALVTYNLATLFAKRRIFPKSMEFYEQVINLATHIIPSKRSCGCLLLPRIDDGQLEFPEVRKPDILELAISAKGEVAKYVQSQEV